MTRDRVLEQLNPLERFIACTIEDEFEKLSKDCEYHFLNSKGTLSCMLHESSLGRCRIELCPRLKRWGNVGWRNLKLKTNPKTRAGGRTWWKSNGVRGKHG